MLMENYKKIRYIYKAINTLWYINLILAGSALVAQLVMMVITDKHVAVSILGKWETQQVITGSFHVGLNKSVAMESVSTSVEPSVILNVKHYDWYAFIYTLILISTVLFFHYQLRKIFYLLDNALALGSPFSPSILPELKKTANGSIIIFAVMACLSVIKLITVKTLTIGSVMYYPVFDSWILNFLWIGLLIWIMIQIFSAGWEQKQEIDLTI